MRLILLFLLLTFSIGIQAQNVNALPFSWYFASYPSKALKTEGADPCSMPVYFRQFDGKGLFEGTGIKFDPADSLHQDWLIRVNSMLSIFDEPCRANTYVCRDVSKFIIDSTYLAFQVKETIHRNPRKTVVGYNKYTRSLNLPPNNLFTNAEKFELGSCRMCVDSIYAVDVPFPHSYLGLVISLHSLNYFDPRTEFSDSTWAVIERSALEVEKAHPELHVNAYHYKADLKRGINSTLSREGIIINFGNEGELHGYFPHLIPWAELPLVWRAFNN